MADAHPWLERRVLAYAHQGGAWEWPSSTLFAMRNAVAAGAHALELDAHGTADGHVVVCHDPTVERTTDGTGASLREVLEAFPDTILNFDLKQSAPVVAPYEEAVANLLAEFGRTDDVIVTSFNDTVTETFSRLAPDVPTSAGTMTTAAFWQAIRHDSVAAFAQRYPSTVTSTAPA